MPSPVKIKVYSKSADKIPMENINLIIAWAAGIIGAALVITAVLGLIFQLLARYSQSEKISSSDIPFIFEADGYTEGATDDFSSSFLQDTDDDTRPNLGL
jgi:hypothetical protein